MTMPPHHSYVSTRDRVIIPG